MDEKNPVELTLEEAVQDDAASTPEPQGQTLEQAVAPDASQQDTPPKSEPGWIKRRVEAAVEKRLAEVESRLRTEYEAKMAPMRDALYERQADQLVADGEFKSRDRALEYVRLKDGVAPLPETPAPETQPRDPQGRFTTRQAPDDTTMTAQMLFAQAEAIKASSGVDVLEVYNSDPDVKKKVLSGEWNFIDVFNSLPEAQTHIPSPTRSANNGSLADMNILKISQAQHAKLNDFLAKGGIINCSKK